MLIFGSGATTTMIDVKTWSLMAAAGVFSFACKSELADSFGHVPVYLGPDASASNGTGDELVEAGSPAAVSERDCPPGQFVMPGSDLANPTCGGCSTGTFSVRVNAAECEAWSVCKPGEYVSAQGSPTRDQICTKCPEDQTSAGQNAGACLPLDACPGGMVETAPATDDDPAQCTPCDAGEYCAGGSSLAHPCVAGEWDHDEDPSTACAAQTTCAVGQYVIDVGSATKDRACEDCNAGSFGLEANAAQCQSFTECAPGSRVAVEGSVASDRVCEACPSASFTAKANQDECEPWTVCKPGEYIAEQGTAKRDQQCEPCPEGQFSTTENAGSCVSDDECPPGSQQLAAGTEDTPPQCADCSAGEYCAGGAAPAESCPAGAWDHDADPATPCAIHTQCLAGTYVKTAGDSFDNQVCAACEAGTFSTANNTSSCSGWQHCAEGTYVQSQGSPTTDVGCVGCPSGSYADSEDQASCSEWTDCQPGFFVESAGSAEADRQCVECPDGQYSVSINAGACVAADQCAQGTRQTTPATGSAPPVCEACTAGNYCAGGEAQGQACSASTWDDDQDPATPCTAKTTCAAGQYVATAGSTTSDRTCTACASGKFSDTSNADECDVWSTCAAGTYIQAAGTSSNDRMCSDCAAGKFSSGTNASSCTTWSTCSAPSFYMSTAPSPTSDRGCSACTPPQATSTDNDTTCEIPAFQMSAGQVSFEAEHYHSISANGAQDAWTLVAVAGISGGQVMQLLDDNATTWMSNIPTTSPRMVYNVNFTSTGTFYLFLRGDTGPQGGGSDSAFAGLDNSPASNYFDFNDSANVWGWISQTISVSTTGLHTIIVWGREDGARIDKIVVSSSSTAPSGNGPAESPLN